MKRFSASKILLSIVLTTLAACSTSHTGLIKKSSHSSRSKASFPDQGEKFNNVRKAPEGNSYYYYVLSRLGTYEGNVEGSLYLVDKAIEQDKSSSFLLGEKAQTSIEANRIDDAISSAKRAIDLNPKNQDALLLLGKIYSAKKMSNEAMSQFNQLLKINPKSEEAYLALAREYVLRKDYDAAILSLTRMKKVLPNSLAADYYLGSIYSGFKKNFSKAEEVFQQIVQENPEEIKAWQALGQIYLEANDLAEALKVYLALEKLIPEDIATQLRLGLLFYEIKNYDEASLRFQKILEANPNSDRIQYYLGVINQIQQKDNEALSYFKQVLPESSFYKESVIRAVIILQDQGKIQEALEITQQAVLAKPEMTEFYDVLSSLFTSLENHEKSVAILQEALDKYPRDEKLHFALGVAYDKKGDTENAIKSMKKVLEINSQHASALNYIGYTYADQGVKLDEAFRMLLQAHQLRPKDGYIVDSLGWVYFKKGDLNKAIYYLMKADEMSPNESSILEHLGDVFYQKGNVPKAKMYYQKALEASEKEPKKSLKESAELARLKQKVMEKVGLK